MKAFQSSWGRGEFVKQVKKRFRVCLVIVFCFCSKKLVFVLFSNLNSKCGFLPFSIHFFCLVIVFNGGFSFIIAINLIPSIWHPHHWTHESHDNHSTERVLTRESHEEPPLRATQGSRELLPAGRRETSQLVPPCGLPRASLCTPVTIWSYQLHYTKNSSTTASTHRWPPDLDWFLHLHHLF